MKGYPLWNLLRMEIHHDGVSWGGWERGGALRVAGSGTYCKSGGKWDLEISVSSPDQLL